MLGINNITAGVRAIIGADQVNHPNKLKGTSDLNSNTVNKVGGTEPNKPASVSSEQALRTIANNYDVSNISHAEKVSLGEDLFNADAINSLEYAVLTTADIPLDGSAINIEQRSNLLERFEFSAKYGRGEDTEEGNKVIDHLLSVMDKLEHMKGTAEINTFA